MSERLCPTGKRSRGSVSISSVYFQRFKKSGSDNRPALLIRSLDVIAKKNS